MQLLSSLQEQMQAKGQGGFWKALTSTVMS
jgi:hypothetical protein